MKINSLQFTEVLSSLLKSGLSLQNALNIAPEIISGKREQKFCLQISKSINEGKSLSDELNKYDKDFSPLYISFIRIGEKSGQLSEVFEKLVEYLKVKKENKERLIQSLIYPLLVLFTAISVVFVIIFVVFPRLEGIFDAFGDASIELKNKISNMYTNLKISGFLILFLFILILMTIILYKYWYPARKKIDSAVVKIPIIGKQIVFSQSHDFSFSMKLLTSTYFPFNESLLLSSKVLSNQKYKKAVENVYSKIMKGNDVGKSFEEEKIFPPYLVTWIKMAEISGNLTESFSQIYEYFKIENKSFSSRLSVVLEPFFILITGIIIITIIGQFVLPIFKLMGAL